MFVWSWIFMNRNQLLPNFRLKVAHKNVLLTTHFRSLYLGILKLHPSVVLFKVLHKKRFWTYYIKNLVNLCYILHILHNCVDDIIRTFPNDISKFRKPLKYYQATSFSSSPLVCILTQIIRVWNSQRKRVDVWQPWITR